MVVPDQKSEQERLESAYLQNRFRENLSTNLTLVTVIQTWNSLISKPLKYIKSHSKEQLGPKREVREERRPVLEWRVRSKLGQWGYFYPMHTYWGPCLLITLFLSLCHTRSPPYQCPTVFGEVTTCSLSRTMSFPLGQHGEIKLNRTPEQLSPTMDGMDSPWQKYTCSGH